MYTISHQATSSTSYTYKFTSHRKEQSSALIKHALFYSTCAEKQSPDPPRRLGAEDQQYSGIGEIIALLCSAMPALWAYAIVALPNLRMARVSGGEEGEVSGGEAGAGWGWKYGTHRMRRKNCSKCAAFSSVGASFVRCSSSTAFSMVHPVVRRKPQRSLGSLCLWRICHAGSCLHRFLMYLIIGSSKRFH